MKNGTSNASQIKSTDWNILQLGEHLGDRAHVSNTKTNLVAKWDLKHDWPEHPRRIAESIEPAPPLLHKLIPESLRAFALDISVRTEMPVETVLAPTLVAFSAVVGNKIAIHPKKKDDWSITPNLWGGLVSSSSSFLKNAAINEALAPFRKLNEPGDVDIYSDGFGGRTIKRRSSLTKMIKAASKRRDIVSIDELKHQIETMIRDANCDEPFIRPYPTTNSKRANIKKLIHENPNGLLIIKGGMDNWMHRLSKPKHKSEREFLLRTSDSVYSGALDRSKNQSRAPSCVFGELNFLAVQKYLAKAIKKGRDIALLQHFHLLICHDGKEIFSSVDRRPDFIARERVDEMFKRVHEAPHSKSESIPAVRFSDESQQIFDQWSYELKLRLKHDENENALLASHLAKQYSLMPRLALIFSILENPENIQGYNSVSACATKLAVQWCKFLERHIKKIYSAYEIAEIMTAKKIARHIEEGIIVDKSSLSSVFRQHHTWQVAPTLVRSAIDTLEDRGWLRIVQSGGLKRILVHPKFNHDLHASPFEGAYAFTSAFETS